MKGHILATVVVVSVIGALFLAISVFINLVSDSIHEGCEAYGKLVVAESKWTSGDCYVKTTNGSWITKRQYQNLILAEAYE